MSKILTDNQYYHQIADVIREQNGTSNTYKPAQMVRALKDLFYEEVEGVPPISFNGIGENLLDYRIDGAVGGVGARTNNLFDKTKTNRKLNQARTVDGSITYTTTASNFFDYYIPVDPNTQYTVTDERYAPSRIYFFKSDKTWIDRTDIAPGDNYPKKRVFTTPSNCYYIQFQESKDKMMNENTLMLNVGNISLPYESYYKIPLKINNISVAIIYLDTLIYENESISLSDTNVNIPTIKGTNVLTVETTVQPSNVYVKSRKESSYETAMRENYEQELSDIESALEEV